MKQKTLALVLAGTLIISLVLMSCKGNSISAAVRDGKGVTFKLAFNQDETHPQYQAMVTFSQILEEKTDGAYQIELYPNELLGAQKETLEMAQTGAVEMTIVANSLLETWNQDFAVFNLPYVFSSVEHQQAVINDKAVVEELYRSLEDQGIKVLCAFHGGVRNVYTSKAPVTKPSDLKGQKIRVMQSDTNLQMMSMMGGTGIAMGQGEVYTAIQTKVLDGAENNELIYNNLAQYEVAKYYSYTKHLMQPDMLTISRDVWNALPEDVQKIFEDELPAIVEQEFELFASAVEESLAAVEKKGATITKDVDIAPFQKEVEPLIQSRLTNARTRKIYKAIQDSSSDFQ